jgi:hypothetical protein
MKGQVIKTFFKQLMTEDDNQTFCIAKLMAVVAFLSFMGYAGYGLYLNKTPDLNAYANGLMITLTGCGAIIAAKQFTQKDKP